MLESHGPMYSSARVGSIAAARDDEYTSRASHYFHSFFSSGAGAGAGAGSGVFGASAAVASLRPFSFRASSRLYVSANVLGSSLSEVSATTLLPPYMISTVSTSF